MLASLGSVLPTPSFAQNLTGTAPQMIGLRFDGFPDAETNQILLIASRRVPVSMLLPNVSTDSYFDILFGAAGVRFGARDTNFRIRAGLIRFDLFRPPFGIGATLIDFDRAGIPDLHARWLALRLGPSLRIGGDDFALEPRLIGSAGMSSLRLGLINYPRLGASAVRTRTGLEVGYRAALLLQLGPALSAKGFYTHDKHFSRSLRFTRRGVEAEYGPSDAFRLFVRFVSEKAVLRGRTQKLETYHVGIRFTPSARGL